MSDLISRQAAVEEIRTYITKPNISDDESEIKGFNDGLELAISVLSVLPSAQPEIVRCKDCKNSRGKIANRTKCGLHNWWVGFDYYCADGEREDDELQTD